MIIKTEVNRSEYLVVPYYMHVHHFIIRFYIIFMFNTKKVKLFRDHLFVVTVILS